MKKKDNIFKSTYLRPSAFNFDKGVAKVFDNMLELSVPFYKEMHRMTVELAMNFAQKKTAIYDIGCSTGTLFLLLSKAIKDKSINFVGLDNSLPMLEKCRKNLKAAKVLPRCTLHGYDINKKVSIKNASVVTMILTLQFARPLQRDRILSQIYKGLNKNGCFILIEKILNQDALLNSLYIDLYHEYKHRSGYSETEIARKRLALENVLIPYQMNENIDLLKRNGFKTVEPFFRWYNFCCLIGVKT